MRMNTIITHPSLARKLLGMLALYVPLLGWSQIGIGTTTPHPSSMLHISAGAGNNKGLIIPQITSASRVVLDNSQNIAPGLVFFDTDLQKLYYFHTSGAWFEMDHDWIRKDVAGASPVVGTHIYLGVSGNVGIGTAANVNPPSKLTVVGKLAVGSATYTQDSVASVANGATFGTWVGIGTATRTSGKELDVKGDVRITNTLLVDGTTTSGRFLGEGVVPEGGIIMYSGSLSDFTNGLGDAGTQFEGWALCDGRNGTPDLRGRFIVGKTNTDGNNYGYTNSEKNDNDYDNIGEHGGEKEVTLTIAEMPAHDHTGTTDTDGSHHHDYNDRYRQTEEVAAAESCCNDIAGNGLNNNSYSTSNAGNHNHDFTTDNTGGGDPHENRPPYYVLAFIMKKH